ncbi:hypothetical protein LSCM1_05895 [Leishmania martiniquensis]|uniref:Uncharacterized protein n=1 Tax=Leishmania martiniquensis TaxID=1580590 RepID=A0A836KRD3_9TRYP|nr:hypothetical protein LSCM1_05895 [Leishmania martiniquensis]
MKRNGNSTPPAPRSLDGGKPARSVASSQARGNPVTVGGSARSPSLSLPLDADGGRGDSLLHGSLDPTPRDAAANSFIVSSTSHVAGSSPTYHRYEQRLFLPHGRNRGSSRAFGKSREPSMSSYEAPVSLGDAARRTSLHRATTSDSDDAQYPQAELSSSSTHIPTGVSASVLSSTAAAAAAGARAAGATVPFLFSLKLPSAAVGRTSGGGVGQSGDSLNGSMSSALGGSSLFSRNQIIGASDAAARSEATSPWKVDETAGAGVDGDHHSPHHRLRRDSSDVAATAVATLLPRDVGPLPATEACTRNRLPSGTHIRRRPRSVVRRHTVAAGVASTNGVPSTRIAGDIEPASPAYGALGATVSSSNALAASHIRQRGVSAILTGASASGGGAANRAGTGRTRDVLPPGTRPRSVTGGAAAAGHRRRADPSPAPSRPPRSHKARAGAAPSTAAGAPSSAAVSGPAFSPTSPSQLGLRASHQSSISLQVSKRVLSETSSPGASSPLTCSLERASFSLAGEKDSLAASTNAAANHQHVISSNSSNRRSRSARSGAFSGATTAAAGTKPPSGRRQSSLARVLAPAHLKASASHMQEHGASPPPQDYAKLAATYMKLCAEVGDEPNMDWVACLAPAKGGERQLDMLLASIAPSTADAKDLSSTYPSKRAPSTLNGSLMVSGHFLLAGPQQQQQQHTPRGGARPRIATGAALSLSATATSVTIPAPPLTSSVRQRASTPAARRTKSPGARHGASSLNSPLALPKRSGSVGRLTSVSRPSIFGSSAQQQQHTSTGDEYNSRARGVEAAMADACAQQMAKYCAEHLQPLVDTMKLLQEQRAAVTLALESFIQVASASLSASAAVAEKGGGEEAWRHSVASLHGYHHGGHSNRGLGSGKDGPISGAIPSTTDSSASTTPRKPSISRNSTTSSLANTATVAIAEPASRRASVAAAAAAKAASLSEALQALQCTVVTLLSTLSDSAALTQAPANGLVSPLSSIGPGGVQPAPTASRRIPNAASVILSDESASGPAEKFNSSLVLASRGDGVGADQPPLPPQGVASAGDVHASQSQASAVDSSATVAAAALPGDAAASRVTAPPRFVEFVRAQEREVAVQLDEVCGAVRQALGSPMTTLEAAITQRSTESSAGAATAAPLVCLEVSDMLSTPFFVPPKYLNSLAIAVAEWSGDGTTAEEGEAATTGGDAVVTSPMAGALPKAPHALSLLKSASNATGKKLQSSKLSSSSGGGGVTGRSSESSTPRVRANDVAMPYTPLFTFATTVDEDEAGDGALVGDPSMCSISARSAEGAACNTHVAVERYLLHCVQPATAAAGNVSRSPRAGTESEHTSSRQNSSLNWTTIDLSASLGSAYGSSAAALNASTKRAAGKSGNRPSARTGAVKSGRAAGGGGSIYQSRPALSASQKAPATPRASAGSTKSRKKTPIALQKKAQQERHEQLQQQRRLVKAWSLWTALKPLAENRDGAAAAGAGEPTFFSRHPSSASASVNASAVAGGRLGDGALTEEVDAASPPMVLSPTAAATPLAPMDSDMRKEVTSERVDGAASPSRLAWEVGNEAASVADSLPSPPPPGALHAPRGHAHFEDEKVDDGGPHSELGATHARPAGSMPSLVGLHAVPRRLDMEDIALLTHSDDSAQPAASTQSSAAALLNSFSMMLTQRTAPRQNSGSGVKDSSSSDASAVALTRVVATEPRNAAACQIAVWYAIVRRRRQAVAQHRAAHWTENAAQRQRVLAARRSAFVRMWVCRWLLRRRIDAEKSRQQASASVAPTAVGTAEDDDLEKTRRAAAAKEKAAAAATVAAASTSRERFQRAKEQRKAALASTAAVTSGMPRVSSSPSASGSGAKEAVVSFAPTRLSPLPLAASGISTFAIRNYHGESNSFTVSAMHRLLNAPPLLLFTTCMVALRYPTNPPMAYLDNGGGVPNHRLDGGEERQKSDAPPAMDERFGDIGGSDHLQRPRQWQQTTPGGSLAGPISGNEESGDRHVGGAFTAQQRRWIKKGLLHIRFLGLRRYACGRYEALIPISGMGGFVDGVHQSPSGHGGLSSLDATLNSATRSYLGSVCATAPATLSVPPTMRYDSTVDPNELQRANPVVKPFHRPFEQWGMAHNLTSRVFCAAAIYSWQLIFSHTPFDDAKQRELPTREEQQARLERVEDRNGIILDCYGVHSEREWLREATKDLSFVSQIYLPHYDRDDPEQQRESRDNYEFVKNFLFQCFPSINTLADIPDYLVGAGLFFVLKEVFHYTKDSPSTHRMHESLPRLVVMEGQDHIASVTPATSVLARDGAGVAPEESNSSSVTAAAAIALPGLAATQLSPAQPREKSEGDGVKGLSGWQRAALLRYEQLRQLHRLSYEMAEQERSAAVVGSGAGAAGSLGKATRPKQLRRSRSPAISATLVGGAAKDNAKEAGGSGGHDSSGVPASTAVDDATLPLRRCIANSPAGPLTPMRSTPLSATLSSPLFTSPSTLRDGVLEKSGAGERRASFTVSVPPRDASVQLVRVPRRLLRPSAASAQFVRDFEEEVSKSIRGAIRASNGCGGRTSLDKFDVQVALTAGAAMSDAIDIAYPKHFLVKLSEALSFELFGLQVSLGNCEDLDSMGQ